MSELKVTDLAEATSANNSDLLEVVVDQGGGSFLSKKITKANLLKTPGSIGLTTDAGNAFIATGIKGYVTIPYHATIKGWSITADKSGSIVFDIWKTNAAVPTIANTITASAKPSLTSQQIATSTTLTGWTTDITAGDIVAFNVDSNSAISRVTLVIQVEK